VLYELLTGNRALPSETLQDTIAAVWNASQSGRPCLRKLRRESANCWAGVFEKMRNVTSSQECPTTDLTLFREELAGPWLESLDQISRTVQRLQASFSVRGKACTRWRVLSISHQGMTSVAGTRFAIPEQKM
jgi:hypothetical protein